MGHFQQTEIITAFAIYLIETEKHGGLQFVHNVKLSIKLSNQK